MRRSSTYTFEGTTAVIDDIVASNPIRTDFGLTQMFIQAESTSEAGIKSVFPSSELRSQFVDELVYIEFETGPDAGQFFRSSLSITNVGTTDLIINFESGIIDRLIGFLIANPDTAIVTNFVRFKEQ